MFFKVCSLLLLVCSAWADPLCLPNTLEGVTLSSTRYQLGQRSVIVKQKGTFHFEFLTGRFATVVETEGPGIKSAVLTFLKFAGRGAFIHTQDMLTGHCKLFLADNQDLLPPKCLPANAKHIADGYLGPNGLFKVSAYSMIIQNVNITANLYVDDNEELIPITELMNGTFGTGGTFQSSKAFYNVSTMIRNLDVLKVIPGCELVDSNDLYTSNPLFRRKRSSFFHI